MTNNQFLRRTGAPTAWCPLLLTLLSLVLLSLVPASLTAQISLSTIRGVVTDATGAVIVGAEIKIVETETSASRTSTTNENGDYELADMPTGTYRLTITAPGFTTFIAEDLVLRSNQIRRINGSLEVGAVTTEVTVTAGTAVIATENAKIQGFVDTKYHADAPWVGGLAGLDPSLYLTTLPLVQQRGGSLWGSTFAGQERGQLQMAQDGHTNDGMVNQINDIFDAEEIVVVTVNNTAEFPRVGYQNIVTKSGNNEFHGRLTYWNLNDAMKAREFFEDEKPRTSIHTISLSASGPIVKNKTFFYASGNYLVVPSGQFNLSDVPTNKMRMGDFSQLLDLSKPITVKDPTTGNPFPNNMLPPSRFSDVSLKTQDLYMPAPNRGDPASVRSNFGWDFPFPRDYRLRKDFTQRIDHHFSEANRFMVRSVLNWGVYVLPRQYPVFAWTRVRFNHHLVFEDTHVFSPTLLNTLRVGFYKEKVTDGDEVYGHTPAQGDEAVAAIGLQGVNPQGLSAQGFPRMDFVNFDRLRTISGGMKLNDHNWGFADTVTWSKGQHVLKFGGEYKPQSRFDNRVNEGTYGTFRFDGRFSGYDWADFLLGIPQQSTRLDQLSGRTKEDSELGLFITDDFKASSRLTLNIGLRWDRFGGGSFSDGLMWRFEQDSGSIVVPQEATGSISPLYNPAIPIVTGQVKPNADMNNFGPRFGAAYRVTDDLVFRGGYGIYSETFGRYSRLLTGGPFEISETYINEIQGGQPLFTFPNPYPGLGQARVPSQSFEGYPLDSTNGKIHQFNLSVEKQIKDIGIRLSYIGSRNRGMNYRINTNKPAPSLIPFSQDRRPWPLFTGGRYWRSDGTQNYDALNFQAQRRMGQFTFDAHYTLTSNYLDTENLENPYAPLRLNRVWSSSRNRVVINTIWRIPVGRGRQFLTDLPAAANHILGGWQIYWIAYLESGFYDNTSFSGSDPSNTNTFGGVPDRISNGNLPPGQRDIDHWFDTSAFVVPPAGRFGNSGKRVIEGPGYQMHHISAGKTFNVNERLTFTFTAAFSNAFNHPAFISPRGNISSQGNVGTVNGLRGGSRARQIELRGRIEW